MDFEFTSEEEQLRASVARFLVERAPTSYVRSMLDDPVGTTAEVWRGLCDIGATGLLAPGHRGGAGMGMTAMGVVLEELGRAVHPGPFLASAVGAVSALSAIDAEDPLLVALADGSHIATLALWDDLRGWQWRKPTTVARGARLTGDKFRVPDAIGADTLLVTASDGDDLGLYAVERGAPGVTVTACETPDGTRKAASVALRDVAGRRVGGDDATAGMATVVDRLLIAHVVDGVGAASAALALAVEYAKQRRQFGRPIGSFQAIQHLCADMLQALELGRAGAYYALWAADNADPVEVHRAATMAMAFASDRFFRIGADTIQIFGGVGFTWEHDAHLYYKRLLSLEHVHGGTGEHLDELAALVVA